MIFLVRTVASCKRKTLTSIMSITSVSPLQRGEWLPSLLGQLSEKCQEVLQPTFHASKTLIIVLRRVHTQSPGKFLSFQSREDVHSFGDYEAPVVFIATATRNRAWAKWLSSTRLFLRNFSFITHRLVLFSFNVSNSLLRFR